MTHIPAVGAAWAFQGSKNKNHNKDWFSPAIIYFLLLLGIHPLQGLKRKVQTKASDSFELSKSDKMSSPDQ